MPVDPKQHTSEQWGDCDMEESDGVTTNQTLTDRTFYIIFEPDYSMQVSESQIKWWVENSDEDYVRFQKFMKEYLAKEELVAKLMETNHGLDPKDRWIYSTTNTFYLPKSNDPLSPYVMLMNWRNPNNPNVHFFEDPKIIGKRANNSDNKLNESNQILEQVAEYVFIHLSFFFLLYLYFL